MYTPAYSKQTQASEIERILQHYPFATLIYTYQGQIEFFHLPLVFKKDTHSLVGHLAKANPASKHLKNTSVLVNILGPHCYISPTWYAPTIDDPNNVATWNYISIKIKGQSQIIESEEFIKKALISLSSQQEKDFAIVENIHSHRNLLEHIVGLEIQIQDIEAKFKLAQSKSPEERRYLAQVLKAHKKTHDQLIGEEILRTLKIF
jgi:transcriptional regulator